MKRFNKPDTENYWHSLAAAYRKQVNFAWWWDNLSPLLLFNALFICTGLLIYRSKFPQIPWLYFSIYIGFSLLFVGIIAFFFSKKKFMNQEKSLVAIETKKKLNNALSVSRLGLRPWPKVSIEEKINKHNFLKWNKGVVAWPLLLSLFMIFFGLFFPVFIQKVNATKPDQMPLSLEEMKNSLEILKSQQNQIDNEDLQKFEHKFAQLANKTPLDWYQHENMEAADALKQQFQAEIKKLSQNLQSVSTILESFDKHAESLPNELVKKLQGDYKNSLSEMSLGQMKLDPELLKKLSSIDLKQIKQIDAKELKQMLENLKQCKNTCKNGLISCGLMPGYDENEAQLLMLIQKYERNSLLGKQCKVPITCAGKGRITRGRGDAPMMLKDKESQLNSKTIESISNKDLSRALPGDLLSVQNSVHKIEKKAAQIRAGGKLSNLGKGAQATWSQTLTPEEKEIMQNFFK